MFVISKYSRRQRGHVVALGLLAMVANGVGRLARMRLQEAGLDPFSVGGRLAEDFGGYLVTEPDLVRRVPDAWEYMPRRATADCWYDFGFQTVVVLFNSPEHERWVIDVPHQGVEFEESMRYLWSLHCGVRAVLVQI